MTYSEEDLSALVDRSWRALRADYAAGRWASWELSCSAHRRLCRDLQELRCARRRDAVMAAAQLDLFGPPPLGERSDGAPA